MLADITILDILILMVKMLIAFGIITVLLFILGEYPMFFIGGGILVSIPTLIWIYGGEWGKTGLIIFFIWLTLTIIWGFMENESKDTSSVVKNETIIQKESTHKKELKAGIEAYKELKQAVKEIEKHGYVEKFIQPINTNQYWDKVQTSVTKENPIEIERFNSGLEFLSYDGKILIIEEKNDYIWEKWDIIEEAIFKAFGELVQIKTVKFP